MSNLVDDIFSALIPIVSRNIQYYSINNIKILTWFDQFDLRPHPGPVNLITQMNIIKLQDNFFNQLVFFPLSRVSLVQENCFLSLIFFLLLSLYSFSTLLVNLSLKLLNLFSWFHSHLSETLFYNTNLSLHVAAELFPTQVQKAL